LKFQDSCKKNIFFLKVQGKCLYPAAGGKIFDIQQPTGDEKPLEKRSLKGSKSEKFACGAIVFFCV
jgi:hypothetical protein